MLAVFVTACTQVSPPPTIAPSPAPPATPSASAAFGRDLRQPEVPGLPFDDPRLGAVFAELRRHPEWLDEPLDRNPTVLALLPGTTVLCLALEGSGGDVFVMIDPSGPWTVDSVAVERGPNFEGGREFTFGGDHPSGDTCASVVFGRLDPWPTNPTAIEVTGNADSALGRVIAEAVHAAPERFGIDRRGIPAVVVGDASRPAPPGWTCLKAMVFVGGPRAQVVIGTRPTGDGRVEVDSRIVERALLTPDPRREGRC